jgi:hypothetical protein
MPGFVTTLMRDGDWWLGKTSVGGVLHAHILLKELVIRKWVGYCSFGMGVTSAIFQVFGNILFASDLFMIEVIHGEITGKQSLMTQIGIWSIPGALLPGIDFTTYSTREHSTGSKVNCSDVV